VLRPQTPTFTFTRNNEPARISVKGSQAPNRQAHPNIVSLLLAKDLLSFFAIAPQHGISVTTHFAGKIKIFAKQLNI